MWTLNIQLFLQWRNYKREGPHNCKEDSSMRIPSYLCFLKGKKNLTGMQIMKRNVRRWSSSITAQLLGSASKIHLQATLFSDIYIYFYRKNHNQIRHEWPERQEKTCCQKRERIYDRSDTRQKQYHQTQQTH